MPFFLTIMIILGIILAVGDWYKIINKTDEKEAQRRNELESARRAEQKRIAEEAARRREEAARIRDEKLKAAMLELENETYDRTLWAKALIMADGSPSKAKALYLRLRIGEL